MTEQTPEHAPTVTKAEHDEDAFGAKREAHLAEIVEAPIRASIERHAKIAELKRRANEPVMRLLYDDAEASTARAELLKEILEHPDDQRRRQTRTFSDPSTNVLPSVHPGTNVFSRPYDFEIRGPSSESAAIATSRVDGTFSFGLPWGVGDGRYATAGLGLTLRAGVTGVAHIRPSWRYDFSYWTFASFGYTGHTQGAAYASVQDANTGAGLAGREVWLWNTDSDAQADDSGYIDSWALALDVLVHEGQLFNVNLMAGGYVYDDHDIILGYSFAQCSMSMSLPFIVVEL